MMLYGTKDHKIELITIPVFMITTFVLKDNLVLSFIVIFMSLLNGFVYANKSRLLRTSDLTLYLLFPLTLSSRGLSFVGLYFVIFMVTGKLWMTLKLKKDSV